MSFNNFEIFKPYTTKKELERLNQLYNIIQSTELPLHEKMISYQSFNKLVGNIRSRIREKKNTKKQQHPKKVIPIWYNKEK